MSEKPAAKEKPEIPREFQPIDNVEDARKFLRDGVKAFASAMIWTKEQKHVLQSHLTFYDAAEHSIYAWRPPDFDPQTFQAQLRELHSRDCFFSVSLPTANIFFKCQYAGSDTDAIKFSEPPKIFKVQRRKDMRLPIPEGYVLKVDVQDPLFPDTIQQLKVIDISAGGLSFLVKEVDAPAFHAGIKLRQVSFTIKGRKITCVAEVRHVQPIKATTRSAGGVKIGILFSDLKASDTQWIAGYVFEEGRKFFSRFL